ncbi:MAG: Ig-like domain-containing protein, partial [Treponema sp.]|nr:Ig-like domain-containing protein [Treponema sp.]
EPGSYGENGELRTKITEKTTIRVVAVCYDAANNPAQERTLGYLIYWPQADIPWNNFSGDLQTPEYYDAMSGDFFLTAESAFLIYPGRDIKAVAFHAQGVKEVRFSLYLLVPGNTYNDSEIELLPEFNNLLKVNPPRGANNYSTSFAWSFVPQPRPAFYIVEAKAFSDKNKASETYRAVFKVQDVSFPDFPVSVSPPALRPLFEFIDGSNSITISGHVSDTRDIESLCLAWINPQSVDYAAMSQMAYFRETNYIGWQTALGLVPNGPYATEGAIDSAHPNKVWRVKLTLFDNINFPSGDAYYVKGFTDGINPETTRKQYKYSISIPLSDFNIGPGAADQPLQSQVFLLKVQNTSQKAAVITYMPQGDASPPLIKITDVQATNHTGSLIPGQFGVIEKFVNGNIITINGTWDEDSVEYLNFNTYLRSNFIISINQIVIPAANITFPVTNPKSGTWRATATVGTTPGITTGILNDTLVVAAQLKDIGGNFSQDGASWLIESDELRLMRISSEMEDKAYSPNAVIDIYLEFNKPVSLKSGRSVSPSLALNVAGGTVRTAQYKSGQTAANTRQYFTYTVQSGQSTTPAASWFDVTDINGAFSGNYWEAAAYPFTWESAYGGNHEEIRITKENSSHTDYTPSTDGGSYKLRRIPVAAHDLAYTLAKQKNISIDTTAPAVTSVKSSNAAGDYTTGAEIYIDVTFNKNVTVANAANPPQLVLAVNNGGNTTVTTNGSVKVNGPVVTFSYTAKTNDTTGNNPVSVNSFTGGGITDIAGNSMTGSPAGTLTGIYINTIAPPAPRFRVFSDSAGTVIGNTVNGSSVNGVSGTGAVDLKNVYNDEVWFAIDAPTGGQAYQLGSLEYSLDNGVNWKKIDVAAGVAFRQNIYGKYTVIARQTDRAGNTSARTNPVSFNWDPGNLVSRVDSSTPNGTYTNNGAGRADTINITVYFRKPLTFANNQTITLNAIRGTGAAHAPATGAAASNQSSFSFTYSVATNDNTPASAKLDVDSWAISGTAADADGVSVNSFIVLPNAGGGNRLNERKDIYVQTGALAIASGPAYTPTTAPGDEEWTGKITLTFNRAVTKRSGNVTITQQTANYRLPAALTEAQSNRYKSARNFDTYYSRGTNGFVNGAPDTSTKFVLSYAQTTVVTPSNTGNAIQQLAWDFLQAESVTLPVTSQDITVSGTALTITLTGSNALQVLGAGYNVNIPAGFVQDSLGYQSPAVTDTPTIPGVNRPFVRVDKKINEDRITAGTGSMAAPQLLANYSRVIQTSARLDCRTPNSVVRYNAVGQQHFADQATTDYNTSEGSSGIHPPGKQNWRNGGPLKADPTLNDEADRVDYYSQPPLPVGSGTPYNNFSSTIPVGDTAEQGYIWRIAARSYNNAETVNSGIFEEIAFRTVLTYELDDMSNITWFGEAATGRRVLEAGDQLWVRGGDAVGSSSVPGFPVNWLDDYGKLNSGGKRAGVRLLELKEKEEIVLTPLPPPAASTYVPYDSWGFNRHSVWRYITWEINVRTWHDVVLGRTIEGTTNPQRANYAWQYGPRQWAYQISGWTSFKNDYTMYPGKHRWIRITGYFYSPGGNVNFVEEFSEIRDPQTGVTFTQPSP